ncbi:MAG TPA: hypothetical protein VMV41_15530 [Cellulomonadaceae bacterium]|nr:hypothetical protein [Cellulomonadaceae bacterium]
MNLDTISQETFNLIKSTITTGLTTGTGVFGVDLIDLVSLVPVETPLRDMFARTTASQGATVAQWRAITNINNQQPSPFVGLDTAGGVVKTSLQDVSAPYQVLAAGYSVTEDAVALARGFADAKAIEIFYALNQWKIMEDKALFGGQSFALPRPAAPTLGDVLTGGSIAASTAVYVGVAARTGSGYFFAAGNSRGNSANVTTSTVAAATHSVTASTTSVRGAVAYDWFGSADGTTWYYMSTTSVPSYTVKAIPVANATPPTTLPDLSTTVPTYNDAADNGSAGTHEFNGLLATLSGDYSSGGPQVTYGSGTASGAVFIDNAGGALTVSGGGISQLDALNLQMYNQNRLSPTAYMISSQEANTISSLVLNNPGAVTYLTMNDPNGRGDIAAGGSVATYVNRSKPGAKIRLEVHPSVTPGTIVARTDTVPFPGSNIGNVFSVRCQRDVYDYVYGSDRASGGPRVDGESRSIETLVNQAPVVNGVIQSISA